MSSRHAHIQEFELLKLYNVFCSDMLFFRPHPEASEVYVTGTFDDWAKTEKLNKVGATFEKEVQLPDASAKILYKVG